MTNKIDVNTRSFNALESLQDRAEEYGLTVTFDQEACILDFGVSSKGGIHAGIELAKCSCGDLVKVNLVHQRIADRNYSAVQVSTDHPLLACIGSQYAGWPVQYGDFFAMGSGPIRALRGQEKILEEFDLLQESPKGVICLETSRIPPTETLTNIAKEAEIDPCQLKVAVAPTSSIAGSIQVIARSVETAMHKLHELGFDLASVNSGIGVAPIPPIANDDLKGIGLTNDSILFGGQVNLWVDADQNQIDEIGPQIPSSSSEDYGTPFYDLFKTKEFNFYEIDPLLFSPAEITIHNLNSGQSKTFGGVNEKLLHESFGF